MAKSWTTVILNLVLLYSCGIREESSKESSGSDAEKHLISDVDLYRSSGDIQVIIEIPAGSNEKWEVNKKTGILERDSINGAPRTINYLGYPANYGFVPQTLLSKESGGDGDPLDAIILGNSIPRGSIVRCKVLGILRFKDQGEQDDKLILADMRSLMYSIRSLDELDASYPELLNILVDWFLNYKGPGKMTFDGFAQKGYAESTIREAHNQFIKESKK